MVSGVSEMFTCIYVCVCVNYVHVQSPWSLEECVVRGGLRKGRES